MRQTEFFVSPDRTICRQDGRWPCNHINCSKSDECRDCQQRCSGTMRNFSCHSLRLHKFILTVFWRNTHLDIKVNGILQGRNQDFSKGGSQTGTPSGDRLLYMVYTAALPSVSAGSVVLSRYEGPLKTSR